MLQEGQTIEFRPRGSSMQPLIKSGQLVRLEPRNGKEVLPGDIVLAKVSGRLYLHKVSAVDGRRIQISNNHGHVNGWTYIERVYGIVTAVAGIPRSSLI